MTFDKTNPYIAYGDDSVSSALLKLNNNHEKTLIILDKYNKFIGILTDGDVRRWILKSTSNLKLEDSVDKVCNKNCKVIKNIKSSDYIPNSRYKLLPVLSDDNILIGIKFSNIDKIDIGKHSIGKNFPVFIIAEIGNNHNGSLERALTMIDLAKEMGVDCVKFQMRNMNAIYRKRSINREGEDLGTEYLIDQLKKFELSIDEHKKIYDYCQEKKITYLCTPWDEKSVEILEAFGVEAYKVASADLTNKPLLECLVKTNKPLLLSTGMSSQDEIKKSINFLNSHGVAYALLHCNSTYPAPFHDINLNWIGGLKKIHPIVGYSGHERGIAVSLASVAMGALVLERHFTLDRAMEGTDHAASLEFDDFSNLIIGVREIESAMGSGTDRVMSQGELINKENLAKSIVASRILKEGCIISRSDLEIKSPGQGLSPMYIDQLVGKRLDRDMDVEDFFYLSDITKQKVRPKNYKFERSWGIPVRYHDFKQFKKLVKPNLYEFHLSYSDLLLDPGKYLEKTEDVDLIVHAPELFENGKLLDLASGDYEYRKKSIEDFNRVVEVTLKLKEYFPKSSRPKIVTNIGGFTMDRPLKQDEVDGCYKIFGESIQAMNLHGCEILPQSMPPFPWHFGGQRHHNLFVIPEHIEKYCEELNLNICLDISHSYLTCNHYNLDFFSFIKKIAKYVSHMHYGDARGLNGEGIQIGDGEIDFITLGKLLKEVCPKASFIPEIWQGHKNDGEGFWIALDKLDGKL